MVFLIILAVLVIIIVLILMVPVGVDFRYENEIVRFSLKIACLKLQLIPKKKKALKEEKPPEEKKEKKKEEKKKEESGEKKKLSLPFNAEEIFKLLKVLVKSIVRFGGKFNVDRFVLHWITPGWWDPYVAARVFASVNAGLSQLAPICSERFHCRDCSVWTDMDFTREAMFLEFGLTTTIRIGQAVGSGIAVLFAVLRIYIRSRRRVKREAKEEKAALEAWLRDHPEDSIPKEEIALTA